MIKVILILAMAIPTFASAGKIKVFNCNESYFSGCLKSKDDKPEIIKKENPFKNLVPKELPKNFSIDNNGYPLYSSPETPVEFREMISNPTKQSVKAYLNAAKYREAKISYINKLMTSVEKELKAELVESAAKKLIAAAKSVNVTVLLNIASSSYKDSVAVMRAVEELVDNYGIGAKIYYVDSKSSDFSDMIFRGEHTPFDSVSEFIGHYGVSISGAYLDSGIARSNLGISKYPAILIENKDKRVISRIYKTNKAKIVSTVKDFILKSGEE